MDPLFAKTGILIQEDIYEENVMKFAWKIVNQKALEVNNELFSMYKPNETTGPFGSLL